MGFRWPQLAGSLWGWALALGLAGCGRGGGEDAVVEAETRSRLVVLAWEDYLPRGLLRAFSEESGVEVDYRVFGATEEMISMLVSDPSAYDLVVVAGSESSRLSGSGLLASLEEAWLPGLERLYGVGSVGAAFVPPEARGFVVPYLWGTTLLAYRRDLVPDPRRSWSLLWDESLPGGVAMLDDVVEAFTVALYGAGRDPRSRSVEDLGVAGRRLIEQAERLKVCYRDDQGVIEALAGGEAVVAVAYSGDAVTAAAEDGRIGCLLPDEGAPVWIDNLAVSRDAPNRESAYRFLAFLLRPESAAMASFETGFATADPMGEALLDPAFRGDEFVFPSEEYLEHCAPYVSTLAGGDREMSRTMGMVKALLAERAEGPGAGGTGRGDAAVR